LTFVALSLGHCHELASVALADEQVDPSERRDSVTVAKGDLFGKMLAGFFFKLPAAAWFFNP
jgi:hypothetical protein